VSGSYIRVRPRGLITWSVGRPGRGPSVLKVEAAFDLDRVNVASSSFENVDVSLIRRRSGLVSEEGVVASVSRRRSIRLKDGVGKRVEPVGGGGEVDGAS
jgi:hypothetical protein